jgi:hypothetical protein
MALVVETLRTYHSVNPVTDETVLSWGAECEYGHTHGATRSGRPDGPPVSLQALIVTVLEADHGCHHELTDGN